MVLRLGLLPQRLKIKFRLDGLTLRRDDLDLCHPGRKLCSLKFQKHLSAFNASTPPVSGLPAHVLAKLLQPDIVILDLSMPVMSDLEAAPQIRDVLPDACLILFTLYGNREVERAAKQAGIDAVVSKADRGEALVKAARAFFS